MSLENVKYEPWLDSHVNERRILATLFKSDIEGFTVRSVRYVQITSILPIGNHWREYAEIYGVIGEAQFRLEDIKTKEKRTYTLKTGDRLFIPQEVALSLIGEKGTVVIVCSAEEQRDSKTHAYNVSP